MGRISKEGREDVLLGCRLAPYLQHSRNAKSNGCQVLAEDLPDRDALLNRYTAAHPQVCKTPSILLDSAQVL